MIAVAKKLKMLRHERGWSQDDVAKQLDISIPAYSKIETGVTDINLSRLEQIANVFEISLSQLIDPETTESDHIAAKELGLVTKRLLDREEEVINLQKKVIALFEEMWAMKNYDSKSTG
jgi:transcriptional regulator with XRE-family HTH domain